MGIISKFRWRWLQIFATLGPAIVAHNVWAQAPLSGADIYGYAFTDPLPHFAGTYPSGSKHPLERIRADGKLTITAREIQQVVLPSTLTIHGEPLKTTLWGYEIRDGGKVYPALYPAWTLEAKRGRKVEINYENGLRNATLYRDGILPVDQTIHWANPYGADHSTNAYTGDVPIVTHLHGGEVPSESDGGPDAWFTPGYDKTGPAWKQGVDARYTYPNNQEGATLWYHDHALGATRLNVYAGLAGFYLLREKDESSRKLPDGPYEIEILLQDRSFRADGQLYYPVDPPNWEVHPFWTPEFFGDVMVVNGKAWPYLEVEPRRYRFHFLNGSNARFFDMFIPGLSMWQIGTDGGFLDNPVETRLGTTLLLGPGERADVIIDFSNHAGNTLRLRNFAAAPFPDGPEIPGDDHLGNIMEFRVLPKSPKDKKDDTFDPSSEPSLALRRGKPLVKLADFERARPDVPIDLTRQLTLNEVMGPGGPLAVVLNNTMWDAEIQETPREGETELWQIINLTADAHPVHLHLVQAQIVSRQQFNKNAYLEQYYGAFGANVDEDEFMATWAGTGPPRKYDEQPGNGVVGGNPLVDPFLTDSPRSPKENERGWKDTFVMLPDQVTTIIARWAPTDLDTRTQKRKLMYDFDPSQGPGYVWHCHILEHEDNEMMRPYAVLPNVYRKVKFSGLVQRKELGDVPMEFMLEQNYPNPFNPLTVINVALPEDTHVKLVLVNSLGQHVKTLVDEDAPAGYHSVELDATGLSSGVYFYQLQAGSNAAVKKMMLLK